MVKGHIHQQLNSIHRGSITVFNKPKKEAEVKDVSFLIKRESWNTEMFKHRYFYLTLQSKDALVINKTTVCLPFKCYDFPVPAPTSDSIKLTSLLFFLSAWHFQLYRFQLPKHHWSYLFKICSLNGVGERSHS